MKCDKCKGKGIIFHRPVEEAPQDNEMCDKCRGSGEIKNDN